MLAADQDNNAMYVFDTFANGLQQLNVRIGTASAATSEYYPPLLPPGKPGELQVPTNISLDSTGRLLIADVWNQRVQRFNHPLMTVTVCPRRRQLSATARSSCMSPCRRPAARS